MKSKKKLLLMSIGLMLIVATKSHSQETDYYKKYEFEEFLKLKTKNDYDYVKTIYKKRTYPYSKKDFIEEGVRG